VLRDTVERWSASSSVRVDADAAERLEGLERLWTRYGAVMNLTSELGAEALERHVLDALQSAECAIAAGATLGGRWLDVGSGGGFPGLVVAALGCWSVTLVEPRERRHSFLTLAVSSLGLLGSVERRRWQAGSKAKGEAGSPSWAVMSARAVFPAAEWLSAASEEAGPETVVLVHAKDREGLGGRSGGSAVRTPFGIVVGYRGAELQRGAGASG